MQALDNFHGYDIVILTKRPMTLPFLADEVVFYLINWIKCSLFNLLNNTI